VLKQPGSKINKKVFLLLFFQKKKCLLPNFARPLEFHMTRRFTATTLACLLAGAAWAQDQTPTVVVPPAPPIVSAPVAPLAPIAPQVSNPPPGLVQTPVPSATPDQTAPDTDQGNATATTAPAAPTVPDLAPTPDNTWLPANTALIGVLDKVDGSTSQLSIPVGGQATAGDLQLSVQACVTRPPNDIPDAAVYLSVQPAAQSGQAPLFRGWMIRSAPGATVVGDGGVTFRVINCS